MKERNIWQRAAATALGIGLAALLAGCILSPGAFTSTLDLRKDGTFTFAYKGEIYILGLSRLADLANKAEGAKKFEPEPCYNENYEEADCSAEEIEEQRQTWDARQEEKRAEDERNSKAFGALLGGVDPSDPAAAEEIATRLRRQHGWNSVEYKGDGLYAVDFSVTSRLGHDFTFPVFEGFPLSNNFVVVNLREGNVVRIEAPGFSVQSNTANPASGLLMATSALGTASEGKGDDSKPPVVPELNGTFTITTNGSILANNTDEGPEAVAAGQQLVWKVSKRTSTAPMALIKLGD